ncbi:hypothetical protein LZC95_30655 [Pendulispora brunnea]|uniref:Extracellular membrane protein CFEM domain-containing protein n=1 Tax=Pendulispora brunnea TaxID=2905690 RepID=A0ABZ2K0U9_9BACT
MMRHLAAVSLFIVTSCFVVACSGSDSSSGGDPGVDGGGGGGGGGNASSTGPEREALCTLAVSRCHRYQDSTGNCTVDHTNVASCYVTFMTECVKKISSPSSCNIDDYDGCMKESALHCDGSTSPKYWKDCMDKDKSCKSKGEIDEGGYIAIEDTCNLLRGLDANGRGDGAECVAGPCDKLEDCLARITP